MSFTIGVRREDKNEWERRVPLVPADLADLKKKHELSVVVQPSPIRVFEEDEYIAAGCEINEDLSAADVVLAVKEIPISLLKANKVYLYFSHTVKGQDYNMPMLRHLLDVGATLIDYERISDENNRRLIFFSIHAGYAGMIESLVGLAERLALSGFKTPLDQVKHAYEYASLEQAKEHLRKIGQKIKADGLGDYKQPLIFGVAGYGNVASGCQEIIECLPIKTVAVSELDKTAAASIEEIGPLVQVVFKEEDMVTPKSKDAQFVLQDYYQHPENYIGTFETHLSKLDVLMNGIYWEDKYPRLLTSKWAKANYGSGKTPRLKVIGDISCDINGSIELTVKAPHPDKPCYVINPHTNILRDGVEGDGPVIMAVDNLPCELPRESSEHFSAVLRDMVPALAEADFGQDFNALNLPAYLKKAVITHKGCLAPDYEYLQGYLDKLNKAGE